MNRQRDAILRDMGLGPIWRLRGAAEAVVEAPGDDVPDAAEPGVNTPPEREMPRAAQVARPPARPADVPRPVADHIDPSVVRAPSLDADAIATMDWSALTDAIHACRSCDLCQQRRQAVPGVGDQQANWLFVGEGPGAEEDARGEPFVGKAGQLLDAMMSAIGIARGDNVYIANTVKCRPPLNRTPETAELAACFPYLARQIALIQPRLIVALGRPAAQSLLNTEIRIASARGKCFDYHGIPVVVTYHPAYLLRNPMDKAKAWEDLCFARREMARLTGGVKE